MCPAPDNVMILVGHGEGKSRKPHGAGEIWRTRVFQTLGLWFSGRRYAKPTMLQYHEMQGLRERGEPSDDRRAHCSVTSPLAHNP